MEQQKHISDLLESARNEVPVTSFSEMKGEFLANLAAGGTTVTATSIAQKSLWKKWLATSFKFKVFIMITTASILIISSILVSSQLTVNSSEADRNVDHPNEESVEIIEVFSENGVQKTTVYNEKREVLHVTIDLSEGAKSKAQIIELDTKVPEVLDHKEMLAIEPMDVRVTETTIGTSDSLKMMKFVVTEKTTNEEIERIQKQAIAAGIDFTFDTKVRNKKIKRLSMRMKKGGYRWSSKITGTDSFSFDFGWWEDANGNFVKFICNKDLTMECGDC